MLPYRIFRNFRRKC